MVAPHKIHCTVIAIPVEQAISSPRLRPRPSDLVPWADPYIASLIEKLQTEVRQERKTSAALPAVDNPRLGALLSRGEVICELEIPWNDESPDIEPGEDRFSDQGDDTSDTSVARA